MSIFLSCEGDNILAPIIINIVRSLKLYIKSIDISNYTDALDSIGIIINCFNKNDINNGFGKERKYISYKNRYADIRLLIDYDEFLNSDAQMRCTLVKDNIFSSIMIVHDKLNNNGINFDYKQLIHDIVFLQDYDI